MPVSMFTTKIDSSQIWETTATRPRPPTIASIASSSGTRPDDRAEHEHEDDQGRREAELELTALEVVLGELVEVVVADVVARDRSFEASAAVVPLDELVDRLDVARVVDADRDDQCVLVA